VPADRPVTARLLRYSVTPLTVIGLPRALAVMVRAAQFPGGPNFTTPWFWPVVAQVTCTDEAVRSDR
jgi:hypothetical protein